MSTCRSSSSIWTSPASSTTGATSTPANDVWRRLAESNGREPHEPVHALLGRVEPVGVVAGDAERGGLDARLLARARLEQLDLEPAPLGPAHLHPQHHLGPVLGVGAARARVDGHQRVAGVVVAGEQPLLLGRGQARLDGVDRLLEAPPARLRVLLGELGEPVEVLGVGLQLREAVEPALRARVLGADLRRGVRVIPEARRPHLRFERAQALLHPSRVKDSPRAGTSAHGWRRGAAAWTDQRPCHLRLAGTRARAWRPDCSTASTPPSATASSAR